MAHNNTIFNQMLQLNSRHDFQRIVNEHNGDYRVRKLTCWDQYIHLMYAQTGNRDSLRDISNGTASIKEKLYHMGAKPAKRSTLSDANNTRPWKIYEAVFFNTLGKVQNVAPKYKLKLPRKLYLMDSTTISLCLSLFPWAEFRQKKGAVKIHTLLQADGSLPTFLNITNGKIHDAKAAKEIPIPKGSFLAIDRAYNDFEQYNHYNNNNIKFATRMKTNAAYDIVETRFADKSTGVLADEIILFRNKVTRNKYPHCLRKITYQDPETGRIFIFLTNEFDLDAKMIADIYKARWEIELFFKALKQNLKIKTFVGTSKNAVLTQIYIAMIAYLLISYYKFKLKSHFSFQALSRLFQINLFERKSLIELVKYGGVRPRKQPVNQQLAFI
ncbi:MAG: IS4 family transposase [bacterium]